ncbi:hypothetical protein KOW79_007046 [Hemibagrus wyckioides]|uniref:Uncharacterized protein n=1 Tax=Hemibagrus wyckioides TaxID=337641 RepID=A0A9D3NUY0_9TELE|nr:hypothetical protein KOW79_007046 [Hemibagrus wyckioides]
MVYIKGAGLITVLSDLTGRRIGVAHCNADALPVGASSSALCYEAAYGFWMAKMERCCVTKTKRQSSAS